MLAQGHAFLPALLTEDETRLLLDAVDRLWPLDRSYWSWLIFDSRDWGRPYQGDAGIAQPPEVVAAVRAAASRTRTRLKAHLPAEDFALFAAGMRMGELAPPLHVDSSYVTVTLSLRGPGTLVFEMREGEGAARFQAATGEGTAVTGTQRQSLTGVPAAVHAAPPRTGDRVALFLEFRSRAVPAASRGGADARVREVAAAIARGDVLDAPRPEGWHKN